MPLYQNPFFRKTIVPWYDSEAVCLATIVFLLAVLLFGIVGITTAVNHEAYSGYLWVPALLTTLSTVVILSTINRMLRRR
jgi:hypothetical protein